MRWSFEKFGKCNESFGEEFFLAYAWDESKEKQLVLKYCAKKSSHGTYWMLNKSIVLTDNGGLLDMEGLRDFLGTWYEKNSVYDNEIEITLIQEMCIGSTKIGDISEEAKKEAEKPSEIIEAYLNPTWKNMKNSKVLIEECRKHYQDKSKTLAETQDDLSSEQKQVDAISKEPKEETVTYNTISEKVNSLLDSITDKSRLYFALVYILKPFYTDQRGDEKRRKLLGFLQLTDSQERFIIESLVNTNLLGRVGDLVFVTNKDEAISVVNHYVDNGQFDLTEIAQLFYQQDEN